MGAALETLEINHPNANAPRQVRLSRNIRRVIDLMVYECVKLPEALLKVGITRGAYNLASSKPEFVAYQGEAMRVLRSSEASRTIARAADLADNAESDHVRLQANTWIAGIEGISVVAKSENLNINKNMSPGMVLNLIIGHAQSDDVRVIDGQAHQVQEPKLINALPRPVPHPSMRNAQQTEGLPGKTEGHAAGRRGAK
jgi:hypothetical protein